MQWLLSIKAKITVRKWKYYVINKYSGKPMENQSTI